MTFRASMHAIYLSQLVLLALRQRTLEAPQVRPVEYAVSTSSSTYPLLVLESSVQSIMASLHKEHIELRMADLGS
jgi:hypothetical protein